MALEPIAFNGMQSLEADELIDINQALVASDCYLDDDTVKPRNGYRALTASALAGSGQTQGVWRFRPSATSARCVASVAGTVYTVTDAASETTQGTAASVASVFGSTANISGAQLGSYFYFATDEAGVTWQRMKPDYTLEALGSLAKGATPSYSLGSLSIVKFNTVSVAYSGNAGSQALFTDWLQLTNSAHSTDLPVGESVTFDVGGSSGVDWTAISWICLFVTCPTLGAGGGTTEISIGNTSNVYTSVASMYDTPGNGSPNVVYVNLNSLDATSRAAVRYIRITASVVAGPTAAYGYMLVASAPTSGPVQYYVTFANSTTGQESLPTDSITVTLASDAIVIPTYHSVWYDKGYKSVGNASPDPNIITAARCFNLGKGLAMPSRSDFGAIPTISGSIPGGSGFDKIRLWRLTGTGWRLVREVGTNQAPYSNGSTFAIPDDQGDAVLTHTLYKAGGTPPQVTALAARAQRLIGAYQNRVFISNYIAPGLSSDPFPQFPSVPVDLDSDGWAFDISPGTDEQIQGLANGDSLYLLSNEAVYSMRELSANSPPFRLLDRGAMGRRAFCWAESQLFFASHDGVYSIREQSEADELTQPIRRMYQTWFAPNSSVVVAYQARKLFIFCSNRFLRYDFVRRRWTRGTLADTVLHAAFWRDPDSAIQRLILMTSSRNLMRWQPDYVVGSANAATDDAGTPIPAWQYNTGFTFAPSKFRVRSVYVDCTGPIQLSLHVSMDDAGRVKEFRPPTHIEPMPADVASHQMRFEIVGLGGAQLKRLMFEPQGVAGEGV